MSDQTAVTKPSTRKWVACSCPRIARFATALVVAMGLMSATSVASALPAVGRAGRSAAVDVSKDPDKRAGKSKKPRYVHDPQIKVEPTEGLDDRQTVKVSGTGFRKRVSLVITQCANKGDQTTQGDCNLDPATMKFVRSDKRGRVKSTEFTVVKGPFGANGIVCTDPATAPNGCIVNLGDLSPDPSADQSNVSITFRA